MYTVISCFCWWRCTPGPTFVSGRLERNCCCCAVVLLNESLAVCSLSAFLMEVTWDAWPKDIWVYWLLHSQHVSEDILQWSIHGKYYTDDIHTYQQQISLLFGLKMQGPLADVEEHILSKVSGILVWQQSSFTGGFFKITQLLKYSLIFACWHMLEASQFPQTNILQMLLPHCLQDVCFRKGDSICTAWPNQKGGACLFHFPFKSYVLVTK